MRRPLCLFAVLFFSVVLLGCPDPKPRDTDSTEVDSGAITDEGDADSTSVVPPTDGEPSNTDGAPADGLEDGPSETDTQPADADLTEPQDSTEVVDPTDNSPADPEVPLTAPGNPKVEPKAGADSEEKKPKNDDSTTKNEEPTEPTANKEVSKEELVDELFGK